MDSQALAERLSSIKAQLDVVIRSVNPGQIVFSEDDEIDLKHFLKNADRAIGNIKRVVNDARSQSPVSPVPPADSSKVTRKALDDHPNVAPRQLEDEGTEDEDSDEALLTSAVGIPEERLLGFDQESVASDGTVDLQDDDLMLDNVKSIGNDGVDDLTDDDQEDKNDGRKGDETGDETDGGEFGDDDFGDDDFNESVLQEIDEAEKSFVDVHEEKPPDFTEDNTEHQPDDQKYLDVLKQYFGYGKFRPLQWKIINSVLNDRRDNCVIMATGYGKSLCYQYPSVYTGGTTVVISPLISLMEDQVLALSAANIEACLLGTAQTQQASVVNGIKKKKYRVVYITPEFAEGASDLLKEISENVAIDLVAVDEAHCVSQWGHDFRASYRTLGNLRSVLVDVPILAVTATATPQVMKDISRSLRLKDPLYTCTGFDRPNLYLSVSMKSGDALKDLRSQMSSSDGRLSFEGPTIIYCPTKKATEEILQYVKRLGVKCALYHAGMSLPNRKQSHKQFINDDIQVVVATVAFGMGIDKPDVRQIIHYGAPKDIESYYQEIGRAGRDGMQSACHVFYSRADFAISKFFLKDITNPTHLQHKQNMMKKMEEYLTTVSCRRRHILSHFENKPMDDIGGTTRCCDNCTKKLENGSKEDTSDEKKEYGPEAMKLMRAVEITGERFGITVPIYFLRGSSNQRLPQRFYSHPEFGSGRSHPEKWWRVFCYQLITEGFLREVPIPNSFGCTVDLTSKAHDWMQTNRAGTPSLKMTPNQELQGQEKVPKVEVSVLGTVPRILPTVLTNIWMSTREAAARSSGIQQKAAVDPQEEQYQRLLYSKLISLRNQMSHERGIPTYVLVSNKSLLDMAKTRPTTLENLLKVDELPVEKAQRYGTEFVKFIRKFCKENSIKSDVVPSEVEVTARMDAKHQAAITSLGETARTTYLLFEQEKMSLEEAAAHRGLKSPTLINHLCEAIKVGLPVDLPRIGITDSVFKQIERVIRNPPINSDISRLTPIKEQLPSEVPFTHIKVVIAVLQRRFGMTGVSIDQAELPSEDSTTQYSQRKDTTSSPDDRPRPEATAQAPPPSGGQKRKLPPWMLKASSSQQPSKKPSLSQRMKKNSLFSR